MASNQGGTAEPDPSVPDGTEGFFFGNPSTGGESMTRTDAALRSPARRYHPSLEEVAVLAREATVIPIYRELDADLETPVSAFLKVASEPYAFLLESVEGGERLARYSFIGTDPFLLVELDRGCARLRRTGTRTAFAAPALGLVRRCGLL
jgi:hypothetical protein